MINPLVDIRIYDQELRMYVSIKVNAANIMALNTILESNGISWNVVVR